MTQRIVERGGATVQRRDRAEHVWLEKIRGGIRDNRTGAATATALSAINSASLTPEIGLRRILIPILFKIPSNRSQSALPQVAATHHEVPSLCSYAFNHGNRTGRQGATGPPKSTKTITLLSTSRIERPTPFPLAQSTSA